MICSSFDQTNMLTSEQCHEKHDTDFVTTHEQCSLRTYEVLGLTFYGGEAHYDDQTLTYNTTTEVYLVETLILRGIRRVRCYP